MPRHKISRVLSKREQQKLSQTILGEHEPNSKQLEGMENVIRTNFRYNQDGLKLKSWAEMVIDAIREHDIVVWLPGEDYDKSYTTWRSEDIRQMSREQHGIPEPTNTNMFEMCASLISEAARTQRSFDGLKHKMDLFAAFAQHQGIQIHKKTSIHQIVAYARFLGLMDYSGCSVYFNCVYRELSDICLLRDYNDTEVTKALEIIKRTTSLSCPRKCNPWRGSMTGATNTEERALLLLWSLLGLRFDSFAMIKSNDTIRCKVSLFNGTSSDAIAINVWKFKVQSCSGQTVYILCNCPNTNDPARDRSQCFCCYGGAQLPDLDAWTPARITALCARVSVNWHAMRRYFLLRTAKTYMNWAHMSAPVKSALNTSLLWGPQGTQYLGYTSDYHKHQEETWNGLFWYGPIRSLNYMAQSAKKVVIPSFDKAKNMRDVATNKLFETLQAPTDPLPSTTKPKAKGRPKKIAVPPPGLLTTTTRFTLSK
jgi:hypothetical protein